MNRGLLRMVERQEEGAVVKGYNGMLWPPVSGTASVKGQDPAPAPATAICLLKCLPNWSGVNVFLTHQDPQFLNLQKGIPVSHCLR